MLCWFSGLLKCCLLFYLYLPWHVQWKLKIGFIFSYIIFPYVPSSAKCVLCILGVLVGSLWCQDVKLKLMTHSYLSSKRRTNCILWDLFFYCQDEYPFTSTARKELNLWARWHFQEWENSAICMPWFDLFFVCMFSFVPLLHISKFSIQYSLCWHMIKTSSVIRI